MLRQNKPMPASPKIIAAAERALASVPTGEIARIFVPWSDFVFSTREGKTYMPPTIAEGIRRVRGDERGHVRASGVHLSLLRSDRDVGNRGTFDPISFRVTLYPTANEATLPHELLHFVQQVGSQLIKLATKAEITLEKRGDRYVILRDGKPTGRERLIATPTPRVGKKKSIGQRLPKVAFALALPTGASRHDQRWRMLFGGPKRKLRAVKAKGSELYFSPDVEQGRSSLSHGEREIELHTNALSAGLNAANDTMLGSSYHAFLNLSVERPQVGRVDPLMVADQALRRTLSYKVYEFADKVRQIKSPMLRNAYLKLAWQVACRELGIPETLRSENKDALGMVEISARAPGMFAKGKRVKGKALEAHREVVAKRGKRERTPPPPPSLSERAQPSNGRPGRPGARSDAARAARAAPPPPPPPPPPPKPRVAKAAPKAPAMLRVEQKEDGWYVGGKRFGSQKAATLEYIRQLGG